MRPAEVDATRSVVRGIMRGAPEQAAAELSEPAVSQPALSQPIPSRPTEPTSAGPVSWPAVSRPAASLLETVPEQAGYSPIPNRYFDHVCAHLSPDEQAVYVQLYRLSHGYGRDTCLVSNSRLSERSSVPVSTLKRAVARLVGRGLVEKVTAVHGPQREQGVTYRVPAVSQPTASQPTVSRPGAGHNKKDQKENLKGDSAAPEGKHPPDCRCLGSGFVDVFENGVKVAVTKCRPAEGK